MSYWNKLERKFEQIAFSRPKRNISRLLVGSMALALLTTGCSLLDPPVEVPSTSNLESTPEISTQAGSPQPSVPTAETPPETIPAEQGGEATPQAALTPQAAVAPIFGLTPFPHDPASGQPGLVWAYNFPISAQEIFVSADGTIYAFSIESQISDPLVYTLTEADNLFRLNADGSAIGSSTLELDKPLMVLESIQDLFTSSTHNPVPPKVLPDGTILAISDDNMVNALAPTGQLLWDFALEAPPKTMPVLSGATYYLIDEKANLYTFDANGLVWNFQSSAASNSANGLAIGPEGYVYYTVTNFSRAYLQAVSPQGEDLWAVELQTDFFYDPLAVSQDGQLLAIRDDLIDASSGQLVELNLPDSVEAYYLGYDGLLYLRSGQYILQVDRLSGGFETNHTVEWIAAGAGSIPPRTVVIDANRVIWLFYWGNSDGSNQLVWLSQAGEVLGNHPLPSFIGGSVIPDYRNSRFVACESLQDFTLLECSLNSPFLDEPLWEMSFEGRGGLYDSSVFTEDYLYFQTWDSTLYKLYLGEALPPGP